MGKVTFSLPDELEEELRLYVIKKYPVRPHGKLGKTVEQAIKEFLEREKK